jgi:hypothetical protein
VRVPLNPALAIYVSFALFPCSVALGKAKAILDCSAEKALAFQFAACGREKMRMSREGGDRARFLLREHAKHDVEWVRVVKMPFPLMNREFLARYMCFTETNGDLILANEQLPDSASVDYGANFRVVRAKTTGVFRFKSINDDTQCEVTVIQHGDAGGFVPEQLAAAKIPQALRGVSEMRELFQRDDEIDGAIKSELVAAIKCVPPAVLPLPPTPYPTLPAAHPTPTPHSTSKQPYLPDEGKLIDEVSAKFESLPAFEKLDSPDHFVHMSSVFKEESSNAIGRATTVRPTSFFRASERSERKKELSAAAHQRPPSSLWCERSVREQRASAKRLAAAAPKQPPSRELASLA